MKKEPRIKSKKNILRICKMYDNGYEIFEIAEILGFKIESAQECVDLHYIRLFDAYLKK